MKKQIYQNGQMDIYVMQGKYFLRLLSVMIWRAEPELIALGKKSENRTLIICVYQITVGYNWENIIKG